MKRKRELERDSVQYAAFRYFWRLNTWMPLDERFVVAIVRTCDDRFNELLKRSSVKRLVEQWKRKYRRREQKNGKS